jgi:hypothetical protein
VNSAYWASSSHYTWASPRAVDQDRRLNYTIKSFSQTFLQMDHLKNIFQICTFEGCQAGNVLIELRGRQRLRHLSLHVRTHLNRRALELLVPYLNWMTLLLSAPLFWIWFISCSIFLWLNINIYITLKCMPILSLIEKCIRNNFIIVKSSNSLCLITKNLLT